MKAISDSTPLIHLAKIGRINLLKNLFKEIYIPREIYEEIIKGKDQHQEVMFIENLVNEKFILVRDATSKIDLPSLHTGELKAMVLCREMKIKNILIDEKEGYDAAELLGLNPLRTTSLLLILLDKKIISFKEFEKSLLDLSLSGYFLSAETYNLLSSAGKNLK